MQFLRTINNTLVVIALSLIPALLSGCINEEGVCGADTESERQTVMEFTIVTRQPNSLRSATRALLPAPNTTQDGFLDENYLDLDNLRFLLFDDQKNLIQSFAPEVEAEAGTNYIKYSVKAFINNPYFLDATGENLTFYIMVLGNYSLLTPSNFSFPTGLALETLFDPSKVGTFEMPKRLGWSSFWRPSYNGADYTDADGNDNQFNNTRAFIPMAGVQNFTVSVADLKNSSPDKPLQLSTETNGKEINMLRALAKIEIIDRINANGEGAATVQPAPADRSYVEKAELMGHFSRGSIMPSFADWNRNGIETQYARTPSIPDGSEFLPISAINDELEISLDDYKNVANFFPDKEATELRADKCRVLSCYLTEYDIAKLGGKDAMWIRATVLNPGDGEEDTRSVFYRIDVAPYTDGRPGAAMNIVRNNIYRYEVRSVSSTLSIKWTVCNMDTGEAKIEFN